MDQKKEESYADVKKNHNQALQLILTNEML
jgi:hypothetical protein